MTPSPTYRPACSAPAPCLRDAGVSMRPLPRRYAGSAEIVLYWDEQNRLLFVADNSHLSLYLYDAGGERAYKLTGDYHLQNTNGQWFENYTLTTPTLYASPYLVANKQGYTKHYYAESERVASRIGGGLDSVDMFIQNFEEFIDKPTVEISPLWTDDYHEEFFDEKRHHNLDHLYSAMECADNVPTVLFECLTILYKYSEYPHHEYEPDCYWYHPDHLGSSSWITFSDGKAVQHLHYLPWGENFVDQRSSTFDGARYTFSAKEKDIETGYSYFGSRYYNSDLSIWLSVDPMADKYPSMSPYVYCANNPVRLVDPNGEEIWEINEEGRIINHDKSFTEKDIVYRVDNNGNRIEGEFVDFDYGTIEQQKSITYSPDGKTVDTYDMYQVRGDDNGTKLFEFIAQTVSGAGIEVTQIQCGEEGKNGLNFITCSHEKPHEEVRNGNTYTVSSEKSGWLVFSGRLQYGYTIRAWNHSHPSSTNASQADMSLKASANKILQDSGRACPQCNIYHVPSKTPIPY